MSLESSQFWACFRGDFNIYIQFDKTERLFRNEIRILCTEAWHCCLHVCCFIWSCTQWKITDLVILDLKFELFFGFIDVLQLLLQFRQLVSDLHVMRIVPGEGVDHPLIIPSHTNVIVVLHQIRIMHTYGCHISNTYLVCTLRKCTCQHYYPIC